MRSRTRSSSGAGKADSSRARASRCPRGSTRSSGKRARASPNSRVANRRAILSANRRRATNVRARADAPSSHCASSTIVKSGRSFAASAKSPRTASPTRNGLGDGPAYRPNATPSASRWGCGSRSARSMNGEHRRWSAANGSSISASTPLVRPTRYPCPASSAYSSSAVLPTPGSPCTTRTPACPPRAVSSSRSSAARSRLRPTRCSRSTITADGAAVFIVSAVCPRPSPTRGLRKSGMRSPPLAVRIRSEHRTVGARRPCGDPRPG